MILARISRSSQKLVLVYKVDSLRVEPRLCYAIKLNRQNGRKSGLSCARVCVGENWINKTLYFRSVFFPLPRSFNYCYASDIILCAVVCCGFHSYSANLITALTIKQQLIIGHRLHFNMYIFSHYLAVGGLCNKHCR